MHTPFSILQKECPLFHTEFWLHIFSIVEYLERYSQRSSDLFFINLKTITLEFSRNTQSW